MVTNTPSNGTGGIVYKLVAVPEPATAALALVTIVCGVFFGARRTRRS
jgi:xanthosine utilization system XapX-like protein